MDGPFDLFVHCEIVFYQSRRGTGLHTLAECKVFDNFEMLRRELDLSFAASYLGELISVLCPEMEPNTDVFDLFLKTLQSLPADVATATGVMRFELRLYRLLGYLPEMNNCVSCGKSLKRRRELKYSPLKGGTLCQKCWGEDKDAPVVSAGALSAMRLLADPDAVNASRLKLTRRILGEVRSALDAQVCFLFEGEPRSLDYVQPKLT